MEDNNKPNFFGITPAPVLFNSDLKDFSVRLFPVISSLCNVNGYCTATNGTLGKWLNCSPVKISRALADLSEHEYINIEIEKNGSGTFRKIYLCISRTEGVVKNDKGGIAKMISGYSNNDKGGISNLPIQKNSIKNNKINNNSSSQTDSQKHLIDSLKAELAELKKQKSSAKKQNSFVPALTMVTAKSEIEKIYTPESLQDSFQQTVGRKIQLDLVKSGLESFILKYDFERYPIFDKSALDTKLFNWLARQKPNLNHNTKPKSKGLKIGTKEYSEKIKQDAARINSQYDF